MESSIRQTTERSKNSEIVFVVHGRNNEARNSLFRFLRSIGLRPLEWSQAIELTGKATPYVGEILDAAFLEAQAVVVLMTPDDDARLRQPYRKADDPKYEDEFTGQCRANVLFEAGMAWGRNPERTILVELGDLRPFSDIGGRHVVKLDNSVSARQGLAQRLRLSGCPIDLRGMDWHTEGDFRIGSSLGTSENSSQAEDPDTRGLESATEASHSVSLPRRKIRALKSLSTNKRFKRIGQIRFDYLPATPTNHGWDLGVDKDNTPPKFSAEAHTPIPGSLMISTKGRYRLDYEVGPSASLCNIMEVALKLSKGATMYIKVKVRSRDASESAEVWLAHTIGPDPPNRLSPIEWQLSVTGEVLDNEWILLKLSIADEVRKTFGGDGWVYQGLLKIRLRGSMSISPITLYAITAE